MPHTGFTWLRPFASIVLWRISSPSADPSVMPPNAPNVRDDTDASATSPCRQFLTMLSLIRRPETVMQSVVTVGSKKCATEMPLPAMLVIRLPTISTSLSEPVDAGMSGLPSSSVGAGGFSVQMTQPRRSTTMFSPGGKNAANLRKREKSSRGRSGSFAGM